VEKGYAIIDGADTIPRPPWRIDVLGSDISRPALARAKKGLYETGPLSSFRAESTNLLRHFPPAGDAGPSGPAMRMTSPALKAAVHFEHFNIAADPLPDRPFDAVFCRNVLVYFSTRSRRRALDRLGGTVREGGYLVLGPTDTLTGMEAFETVWAPSAVIYRQRNDDDRGLR
jgi:chemotaxis protein methyltransferase CheR